MFVYFWPTVLRQVDNEKGWVKLERLPADALELVKGFVFESFSRNLCKRNIEFSQADFCDLGDYHTSRASLNHSNIWGKHDRMLPRREVKSMEDILGNSISSIVGAFKISDEEGVGHGNIYWRLVRPFENSDVGPAHRDSWFWDMNPNQTMPAGTNRRYKVWIPLIAESGINTLAVIDGSQTDKNIGYVCRERGGLMKPYPTKPFRDSDFNCLDLEVGEPVLFHDTLVHKGTLNKAKHTRVSIEFTVCVNRS